MERLNIVVVCCFVLLGCSLVSPLQRGYLYPHGQGTPDRILPPIDDVSGPEFFLRTPIVFFGEVYISIFVNSNGLLSFLTEIPQFFNIQFPLDYPVIAPFYSNIDVRGSGAVYYRESQDQVILDRATRTVRSAFTSAKDFTAKSALIVTWEDVGYHKQGVDKVNTFQAIVISNGTDSYVEFLYPDNGIKWIQGGGQYSGLPDALAQAGFISADGRMYSLKGSGTDQVRNLNEWTNTDNPGQWLFRVGILGPEGNIEVPDVKNEDEDNNTQFCAYGVRSCHSKATCVDFDSGYCCVCQSGYFGNGKNCLSEDLPIRVNGKISGNVNGVELRDLDLQAYVVPGDGRTYTAISAVPKIIGYDMQSLSILGKSIGWLFARPVKGAFNGYQLTGGVFNQTATVTFPQSGHILTLKQRFSGLDVFQQLVMTGEVKGSLPNFPTGSKIVIKDHDEQLTRVRPGMLISHSSQVFQLEGTDIDNTYTVEQTFTFDECLGTLPTAGTTRLRILRTYIEFEQDQGIIRYAMTNKVIPLGIEEDPCKEGKASCPRHSTCIVENESYRCVCHPGYELIYDDKNSVGHCLDVDECAVGTSNCALEATCINNPGSFECQCIDGFSGDGFTCTKLLSCADINCSINADCVHRAKGPPMCFCKSGYRGNGQVCEKEEDSINREEPTEEHKPTLLEPECKHRRCNCPEGYDLNDSETKCVLRDATNAQQEAETICFLENLCFCPQGFYYSNKKCIFSGTDLQTKGISNSSIPCNVLNRCDHNAQCVVDSSIGVYHCICNSGFTGNGYSCQSNDQQFHNPNDECSSPLDCVGNADCIWDAATNGNICVCHPGFSKDSVTRTCIETRNPSPSSCLNVNDCHSDATCVLISESTGESDCRCNPGFEGDGRTYCTKQQLGCNVLNNCAIGTAECRYDSAAVGYRCKCKQGYQGDGLACYPLLTCLDDPSLCGEHASCVLSSYGDYACQCNEGFVGNGQLCRHVMQRPGNFLFIAQGMTILKVPFQPTKNNNGRPIILLALQQAIAIETDCAEGRIYWSDIAGGNIYTSDFNGKDVRRLIENDIGSVEGLSIDWLSRTIYWTDSSRDTVEVASLDNSSLRKKLITTGLVNPRGIAVHPNRGKIFWADWNRDDPKIEWANMDGTGRAVFKSVPKVQLPNSLAIDFNTDELCWADAGTKNIECVGIDNNYERTITSNLSYPFGLTIAQDHYYWTDWMTQKIERVTRPGQTREKPIAAPLGSTGKLYGIVAVQDTCPRLSNICQHENGRCPKDHLCLLDGKQGRTCLCAHQNCE